MRWHFSPCLMQYQPCHIFFFHTAIIPQNSVRRNFSANFFLAIHILKNNQFWVIFSARLMK